MQAGARLCKELSYTNKMRQKRERKMGKEAPCCAAMYTLLRPTGLKLMFFMEG